MTKTVIWRVFKLCFGAAVAGFFVWQILRHLDVADIGNVLSEARFEWIIAAIGFFLAGYASRIARWRSMLLRDNPDIRWSTCAVPFMGSIAANNVLPFRAGDALRALAFSSWLRVPNSAVIATLLVERLLDLLSLLIVLGISLVLFDLDAGSSGTLVGISGTGLIIVGLLVAAFLLFPRIAKPLIRAVLRGLGKAAPRLATRLSGICDTIVSTLIHLAQGPRMALLVLWSIAVWGFEGAVFWAAACALPGILDPMAGFLALPVGTLATLLPSTPGYVGTFDFFVIKAMELLGNPSVAAAAFAILVHLILWLPATLIGAACMAFWMLTRKAPSNASVEEI